MNAVNKTLPHILRRCAHVAIIAIPIIYYYFLVPVVSTKILHVSILIVIFFVFLFEKFRLRMKLVFYGQRQNEALRISAFSWTVFSLGIILFFSPVIDYVLPIVATCALVDPLLGEMRLHHMNKMVTVCVGLVAAWIIWFACAYYYHFPFYIAAFLAPISVAVEWPNFRWIDDNALMLLVPFLIVSGAYMDSSVL